eukprot:6852738-Prymnesium_polylepis.1
MDIKDLEGDQMAGVRTVAVAVGPQRALMLSMLPLAAGAIAAASVPAASAALVVQGAVAIWSMNGGFAPERLAMAIELAPLWLLCALIALVA